MFSRAGFTEERVERIISPADWLVAGHLSVRLDAVLQTVELPAGIAHLYASLADMYWDTLPLQTKDKNEYIILSWIGPLKYQLSSIFV